MTIKKINNVPGNLKVSVRKISDQDLEKQETFSKFYLAGMIAVMVYLNYKFAKGKI